MFATETENVTILNNQDKAYIYSIAINNLYLLILLLNKLFDFVGSLLQASFPRQALYGPGSGWNKNWKLV